MLCSDDTTRKSMHCQSAHCMLNITHRVQWQTHTPTNAQPLTGLHHRMLLMLLSSWTYTVDKLCYHCRLRVSLWSLSGVEASKIISGACQGTESLSPLTSCVSDSEPHFIGAACLHPRLVRHSQVHGAGAVKCDVLATAGVHNLPQVACQWAPISRRGGRSIQGGRASRAGCGVRPACDDGCCVLGQLRVAAGANAAATTTGATGAGHNCSSSRQRSDTQQ